MLRGGRGREDGRGASHIDEAHLIEKRSRRASKALYLLITRPIIRPWLTGSISSYLVVIEQHVSVELD